MDLDNEELKVTKNRSTDDMLSEEEKKAIKKIKRLLYMFSESQELDILLNLIQKQSKEIEELKDKINKSIGHINSCKTSLGNYILSPNETEYLLKVLGGLDE